MRKSHGGANSQREMFARSKRPTIAIDPNHHLVRLTETLDWTEMEKRAERVREKKLKNGAGRPPNLRTMLGAIIFMATRRLTYRETEDQIRYYFASDLHVAQRAACVSEMGRPTERRPNPTTPRRLDTCAH